MEGTEAGVSSPAILLASTSPQRRAILEQLGIPFEAVVPDFEEVGYDPHEHAVGKARSIDGGDRAVLGVDTIVRLGDRKSTRLNSSHIQKSRMPSSA